MITDYYIIATLIYLFCMGLVYLIWRRRNIDRREYFLLFFVGLVMIWLSPALMDRLGPTTLIMIYTLVPLTAAVISTRIGKKDMDEQGIDHAVMGELAPVSANEAFPEMMGVAGEEPLASKDEASPKTLGRWFRDKIRRFKPTDDRLVPAAAAEVSVAESLPAAEPVDDGQAAVGVPLAEETDAEVMASADETRLLTPEEPLPRWFRDDVKRVEPKDDQPISVEDAAISAAESLSAAEPVDDDVAAVVPLLVEEADAAEMEVARQDDIPEMIMVADAPDGARDDAEGSALEAQAVVSDGSPVDTDAEVVALDDPGMNASSDVAPQEPVSQLTQVEAIEVDVHLVSVQETEDVSPVQEAEEATGPELQPDITIVSEMTGLLETMDAEPVVSVAESAEDDSDNTVAALNVETMGSEAVDLPATDNGVTREAKLVAEDHIPSDEQMVETGDRESSDGPAAIDDEMTTPPREEVSAGLEAEEVPVELLTAELTAVAVEAPSETDSDEIEAEKISVAVMEDVSERAPVEPKEMAVPDFGIRNEAASDIAEELLSAGEDTTGPILTAEAVDGAAPEIEKAVETPAAIIDEQVDDMEQEIPHNIVEETVASARAEEIFMETEAGIVPVVSEQKQVKSARERMLEEKVNRLLEAGFQAKFSSHWIEAIRRFEEVLKITKDVALRGMLVRDIAFMYLEVTDYRQAEQTYQNYLTDDLPLEERNSVAREALKLRYMEQELTAHNMPLMPYRKVPRLLQIKVEETLNRIDISKQVEGSKKRK